MRVFFFSLCFPMTLSHMKLGLMRQIIPILDPRSLSIQLVGG